MQTIAISAFAGFGIHRPFWRLRWYRISRALLAATLAAIPNMSMACMGANYARVTFFETLPDTLLNQPVVAKVKLLEGVHRPTFPRSKSTANPHKADVKTFGTPLQAKVVEAISGVTLGETLKVNVVFTSCHFYDQRTGTVGTDWYIAGEMRGGEFYGSHRLGDLDTY